MRNFYIVISFGFFISGIIIFLNFKQEKIILSNNEEQIFASFDEETCNEEDYLLSWQTENIVAEPTHEKYDFKSIKKGEHLNSLFYGLSIPQSEVYNLSAALKPDLYDKDILEGDLYYFELENLNNGNVIKKFVLEKKDQNRIPITYELTRTNSQKFSLKKSRPVITTKMQYFSLNLDSTLYKTFKALPFGEELMQQFITIFSWQMDLPKSVLRSDKIEILVEERYNNGEFIGYGKIKMAKYIQANRVLEAFYFESLDKKHLGLFDGLGRSLEKEFLLSPVHEAFATSEQKWRMHPVRKIRVRHNGIDFRGVVGTPFFAIGNGVVTEKRFDKNVGHMMRIKHDYGVYSEYFHANDLKENLKEGSLVKRGQVIGSIGRTGRLCTGPHLHLGIYKMHKEKRKYIDLLSLRKVLKQRQPLANTYLLEFEQNKKELLALIEDKKNQQKIANN